RRRRGVHDPTRAGAGDERVAGYVLDARAGGGEREAILALAGSEAFEVPEGPGDVVAARQRLRCGQQVGPAIACELEIIQVEAAYIFTEVNGHLTDGAVAVVGSDSGDD